MLLFNTPPAALVKERTQMSSEPCREREVWEERREKESECPVNRAQREKLFLQFTSIDKCINNEGKRRGED